MTLLKEILTKLVDIPSLKANKREIAIIPLPHTQEVPAI